ncbi:MAG: UbiA family prenyltransferase [Candidatus Zixiibacteriota bacterium]
MNSILAILRLTRVGNCIMAAIAVLIGVHLGGAMVLSAAGLFAALGTFLVCAAGNTHNDILDIDIDRISHPNRVLVQGVVSTRLAITVVIICDLAAVALASLVNAAVLFMALGAILLLLIYNSLLKRMPGAGNLIIAALAGLTILAGGVVATTLDEIAWFRLLAGALFAFLVHLVREIVKDILDIPGDKAAGVRTLPQLIGTPAALAICLGLGILLVAATVVPVLANWFNWYFAVIVLVLIDLPLLGMLNLVWFRPNEARLRLTVAVLKTAMAVGMAALVVGTL